MANFNPANMSLNLYLTEDTRDDVLKITPASCEGSIRRGQDKYKFKRKDCKDLDKLSVDKIFKLLFSESPTLSYTLEEGKAKLDFNPVQAAVFRGIKICIKVLNAKGKFYVHLNPSDLNCARCWFKSTGQSTKQLTKLDRTSLAGLTPQQITRLLYQVNQNFGVFIAENCSLLRFYRLEKPDFSVKNSAELAKILQLGPLQTWLSNLAHEIAVQFNQYRKPPPETFEEIAELPEVLSQEDNRDIIDNIITQIRESTIDLMPFLSAFKRIFLKLKAQDDARLDQLYQLAYETRDLDENDETLGKKFDACFEKLRAEKSVLKSGDVVNILSALFAKIKDLHDHQDNYNDIISYLELVHILLGTMIASRVPDGNLQRDKRDEFRASVKKFHGHRNLRISFLAESALQALAFIPTDDTTAKQCLRICRHVFAALATLGDLDLKPLAIFKLPKVAVDFYDECKAAVKEIEQVPKKWFLQLTHLLLKQDPTSFLSDDAQAQLNLTPKKRGALLQNPYFLMGLVDQFGTLLSNPLVDENLVLNGVGLLHDIVRDNMGSGPSPSGGKLKIVVDKHKAKHGYPGQLANFAISLMQRALSHADNEVKRRARENLQALGALQAQPATAALPTRLFDEAYWLTVPLEWRAKKLLQEDSAFQLEMGFYQPFVQAYRTPFSSGTLLEDKIAEFLNDPKKKVLLVSGAPGLGKSFASKRYTWQHLLDILPDEYLPILVPLNKFTMEQVTGGRFFASVLERYGFRDPKQLQQQLDKLRERPVLWIGEGYDEMEFPLNQHNRKMVFKNLFQTNDFQNWPNAKLMFTTRTGFCPDRHFAPNDSSLLEKFILEFPKGRKIVEYITNYVERLALEKDRPKWPKDKYTKVLTALYLSGINVDGTFSNPLFFKVIVSALPIVEQRLRRELSKTDKEMGYFIENEQEAVKRELFRLITCAIAVRAIQKLSANTVTTNQLAYGDILDYSVHVAEAMRISGKTKSGFTTAEVATVYPSLPYLKDLLQEDDRETLLRNTCLVCNDNCWQFVNNAFHLFFLDLFVNKTHLDEIKGFIEGNNDVYGLKPLNLYM